MSGKQRESNRFCCPVRRPTATCDAYAMSNAANAAARAKLGDLVFYDFTHFHLVMAVPSACSWAGLATLGGGVGGGGQVWLNTNTWTQTFGTFQVPLQESIHNFVLYHGFASGIEYQDKTTFMGTGQACPSVTEKVGPLVSDYSFLIAIVPASISALRSFMCACTFCYTHLGPFSPAVPFHTCTALAGLGLPYYRC